MPSLDDQIDQLYQLPLAEFTAARNALAKQVGPAGSAIRQLEKPALAAWVVNQIYWRHRRDYDRLIVASGRLRAAQSRQLAGGNADVPTAEAAHDDARRAVMDLVRDVMRLAGDTASPATMTGISETLMALPGEERVGRLTRPLKPLGFQALIGLMMGGPGGARLKSASGALPPPKAGAPAAANAKRDADEATRAELARQKERDARRALVHAELEDVRTAERAALAAAAKAKAALTAARAEQARIESELADASERVRDLHAALARDEQQAAAQAQKRAALEERLDDLGSA